MLNCMNWQLIILKENSKNVLHFSFFIAELFIGLQPISLITAWPTFQQLSSPGVTAVLQTIMKVQQILASLGFPTRLEEILCKPIRF